MNRRRMTIRFRVPTSGPWSRLISNVRRLPVVLVRVAMRVVCPKMRVRKLALFGSGLGKLRPKVLSDPVRPLRRMVR